MRRFTKTILATVSGIFIVPQQVYAQANVNVDPTDKFKLEPIKIPLFNVGNTVNFSIFSWLAFAGSLATVGLVIFWIYLMIRAGIKGLQSEGKPEGIAEAANQVKSVLIGMFITFLFPAILSLAGTFVGVGNIFQWPKMFSYCNGSAAVGQSTQDTYYFQVFLREGAASADSKCNQS